MDEDSISYPDQEVARVLASSVGSQLFEPVQSHSQSLPCFINEENKPAKKRPSTVLTNVSRGNTATLTPNLRSRLSPHQLAGQGELDMLKQCLEDCFLDVDVVDDFGFTPLLWATAYNQLKTAQYLVGIGANPRHHGNCGETALAIAASRGNESIIAFLLTDCCCNVNSVDDSQNSPLLYAVAEKNLGCVKLLLDNGADISHKNRNNMSAFDVALSHKHFDIQRELEKCMLNLLVGKA